MGRRSFFLLGIMFFVIHGLIGEASATVSFNVEQGFEGYVVPGRCIPLRVTVEGLTGPAKIEMEEWIEDDRGVSVSYPVITSGEQTRLEIPIYARETGGRYILRLVVGEQVLSKLTLDTSQRVFPGHLILTCGASPSIRRALKGILGPEEPVWIVGVDTTELPKTIPGYDSVSSLIIRDPGPILNPAQIRALRVWLSGGGRMVVLEPQPLENSLLSGIISNLPREKSRRWSLGLGRIIVLDRQLIAGHLGEREFWKNQLTLQPFMKSKRLSIIPAFMSKKEIAKPMGFSWKAALFLISWAGIVILIRRFCKKTAFWIIGSSLIVAILAFPMGNELAKEWHRGAEVRSRVVALPCGEGLFFETRVRPLRRGIWRSMMGYRPSPWRIDIRQTDYGDGVIQEGRRGGVLWRYGGGAPQQLDLPIENGLRRVGWIPTKYVTAEDRVQAFMAGADFVAVWENGEWQVLRRSKNRPATWVSSKTLPKELVEESEWTRSVTRFQAESRWIFGYGRIPGLKLFIQNDLATKGYWALPMMEGEAP